VRPRLARVLALAATAGVALAIAGALRARPASLARAAEARAGMGADGVQEIAIASERGEWTPNVLRARAGVPLRLRVDVRDAHACATRVLVPDLKLDLALPARGEAALVIPAAPAGDYLFTCEMRMVKGVIHLE
jgi:plastocyanin domain-containing protein